MSAQCPKRLIPLGCSSLARYLTFFFSSFPFCVRLCVFLLHPFRIWVKVFLSSPPHLNRRSQPYCILRIIYGHNRPALFSLSLSPCYSSYPRSIIFFVSAKSWLNGKENNVKLKAWNRCANPSAWRCVIIHAVREPLLDWPMHPKRRETQETLECQ